MHKYGRKLDELTRLKDKVTEEFTDSRVDAAIVWLRVVLVEALEHAADDCYRRRYWHRRILVGHEFGVV